MHLLVALALALVLGASASAPPETILPLPFEVIGAAPDWSGVALAEAMLDALAQETGDNFLTLKQLDAVLRRKDLELGDPAIPLRAQEWSEFLGATELVTGTVSLAGDQLQIEAKLSRADGALLESARAQGTLDRLPQLEQQVARGLFGKAQLRSGSSLALEEEAHCFLLLARQSLAPRSHSLLKEERLAEAGRHCAAALAADSKMDAAHAESAVLAVARQKPGEAQRELRLAQADGKFCWLAPLADSWAERRRGDAAGAQAALEKALASHPGFLHALGYLAEAELDRDDAAGALASFDRYLARAPGNAWAETMRAKALAQEGRVDEAIALTQAAIAKSRDPELKIELASRYLDKGDDAAAEKILLGLLEEKPPRPRVFLRLGYLAMRAGKLKEARGRFLRAIAAAARPDEARTRALAYADLAQVAGRESSYEGAVESLLAARREGLRRLPCEVPELRQWKGRPELAKLCSGENAPRPGGAVDDENDAVALDQQ